MIVMQTHSWRFASDLVWSPERSAVVGRERVAWRWRRGSPAHTDCCVRRSPTSRHLEGQAAGKAVETSPTTIIKTSYILSFWCQVF